MLVVKHNPCHWFAMIVAFEDAEWSIWPDASVIAMTVVRRCYSATCMLYWTHRFPNPWGWVRGARRWQLGAAVRRRARRPRPGTARCAAVRSGPARQRGPAPGGCGPGRRCCRLLAGAVRFGPRLEALAAYLRHAQHLPVALSPGTVETSRKQRRNLS